MSGGSGTNNSWTILTSEESVAETLRPFAAGTEQHEGSRTSATGSGETDQPAKSAASAEGLPVGDHLVSEQNPAELGPSERSSAPPSLEVSATLDHDDKASPMEGRAEGPPRPGSDPESPPDPYTLLTPSLDGPPPEQAEFTPTEEKFAEEESRHLRSEQKLRQKGEESEQRPQTTDSGKRAEADEDRTEETAAQGEPEVRRKSSLLAALEQIGRREEDEDEEEEFQVPQQENSSVFSLNKCILGAVILLAFGTIFFSESDHAAGELRDAEAAGKQEWLSPEVPPHGDADSSELLNKLAEGNQQISALRAQLQAQKEELKVAKEQAAEGAKGRLLWEEVEKENSRLKTEMTSLPVLQKENDRMKKELESVPALQKELETLRSTVTKLKLSSAASETAQADVSLSTPPPPGQPEDGSQVTAGSTDRQSRKLWDNQKEKKDLKRDKYETAEKKQPKERDKSARKEGEEREFKSGGKKEWKKEKHQEEKDKAGKHKRQGDEVKDWKREKSGRGDDGKLWKDKEEREWKKGKHENVNEGKERRGKEEKKDWQKGGEGWKREKDWKKGKDGSKESGKEKWEGKAWKETGEKREWRKDGERRDKNSKDWGKEGKGKSERKQWENGKNHGKDERKSKTEKQDEEWKRRDEELDQWKRGAQKEKKHQKDWEKDQSNSLKTKNEHRSTEIHEHKNEHLYGEQKPPHSHRRPSVGQPEYWLQQRDRLRRDPRPPQRCDSPESCAQAERLLPVTFPEFQAVLQPYLTKAEEAGVDDSQTEELKKLAAEFFEDGVFVHDQMSFQDFAEDLGDVLEDMVEGEDGDEDEEDSALEDEMEEFEKEVVKRFSVPEVREREKRIAGERRKESGQERG